MIIRAPRFDPNPPIGRHEWEPDDLVAREADAETERRIRAAAAAGGDVRATFHDAEASAVADLGSRLEQVRRELTVALVGASDFRRFQLNALLSDVDRLLDAARRDITNASQKNYQRASELGQAHADEPLRAAGVIVHLPSGLDPVLVSNAFDNTADLLTETMQQFRTRVATNVRRVATSGDAFSTNMLDLARQIGAAGLDNAEYRAERILRTELGRTFSGSTFDRSAQLASRVSAMRKIWIRTRDRRTRDTHTETGIRYARGKGIPIDALFQVGAARMRFPIDPQAAPPGKVAARETIMCRCNMAVDFDPAALADQTRQRVSVAVGRPLAAPEPPAAPSPVPAPRPSTPAPVPVPVPLPMPPPAPPVVRTPKPKTPKPVFSQPIAPQPGALTRAVAPAPVAGGKSVAEALEIPPGKTWDWARSALALLDRVHGATFLRNMAVPLKASSGSATLGAYAYRSSGPVDIAISSKGAHRELTLFHELGHLLDHEAIGKAQPAQWRTRPVVQAVGRGRSKTYQRIDVSEPVYAPNTPGVRLGSYSTEAAPADVAGIPGMAEFLTAARDSQAVKSLQALRTNYSGAVSSTHVRYLLQAREVWARAYAQFIAVESGDPGMAANLDLELKKQGIYKSQWEPQDFEPIREAMRKIFKGQGWLRKP